MELLWLSFIVILTMLGSWWLINVSRRQGEQFKKGRMIASILSLIIACASFLVLQIYWEQQVNQSSGGPSGAIAAGAGGAFLLLATTIICFTSFIVIMIVVALVLDIQYWYQRNQ